MKDEVKCSKCGTVMHEVRRETVMVEPEEDMTEGQEADYIAAQESGDPGEWAATEIVYECPKCKNMTSITYN